jgi:hypothetical protein
MRKTKAKVILNLNRIKELFTACLQIDSCVFIAHSLGTLFICEADQTELGQNEAIV